MKQEEARREALRLFPAWARDNNLEPDPQGTGRRIGGNDAMFFYQFLCAEHRELLDFRFPGDKWQAVHGWLIAAHISD